MLQGNGNKAFRNCMRRKIKSNLVNPNVMARRPGLLSEKRTLHLKVPFTKFKHLATDHSVCTEQFGTICQMISGRLPILEHLREN